MSEAPYPYQDDRLAVDQRVEDLLARVSLEVRFGDVAPEGAWPFDLPCSMGAVDAHHGITRELDPARFVTNCINDLATFAVPYWPGRLTAIAYDAAGREIGRDTLVSAGSGLRLRVSPECDALGADGADLAYVPIEFTDDAGIVRPLADRVVTVEVTGAGTLLGFGSAQPITEEGLSNVRYSTYLGRALAVVRAGHASGDVTIHVSAEGCDPVRIVLPVREP